MHTKSRLTEVLPIAGILLLILDSKTALSSAREGMELILSAVIPSLFPFFFLSIWLTSSSQDTSGALLRWLGRLFRIPQGREQLLIPAFLGGYPSGAQAVASLRSQNRITEQSAQRLLGYCNNAGPSFLFGIIGPMFPNAAWVWLLWGLHICGALIAAYLLPYKAETAVPPAQKKRASMQQVLSSAIRIMAAVCGWILLFRILLGFLNKWTGGYLSPEGRVICSGILELTNGCSLLMSVSDLRIRFLLCCGLVSMGGFCVTAQTMSVTRGLSLRYYCLGKTIQTVFCLCAGGALVFQRWYPLCIPAVAGMFLLLKKEKTSSILRAAGV